MSANQYRVNSIRKQFAKGQFDLNIISKKVYLSLTSVYRIISMDADLRTIYFEEKKRQMQARNNAIVADAKNGVHRVDIAKKYNLHPLHVYRIIKGKTNKSATISK